MDYRYLGETGVQVSSFGLGTMTFGGSGSTFFEGVGNVEQSTFPQMARQAFEKGINLFDTADVYSRGVSEIALGDAVKPFRDKVLISTKVHGRMSDGPNDGGQSRLHIIKACEDSLRRLGTDYIDFYHIHNFDAFTSFDESLSALTSLVDAGKVRYLGASNLASWQMMKALGVSDRRNLSRYVVYQGYYNLLAREAEHELIPCCIDQRMGFFVWSPLAGGLLTAKYTHGDTGRVDRLAPQGSVTAQSLKQIIEELESIAVQRQVTASQVALNWVEARRGVTSVLIGARSAKQLTDNISASDWSLTEVEIESLDKASAQALPYPQWHQLQHNKRRAGLAPELVSQ